MSNRERLDSWKEIATYLGRDVRTVIRWEAERGLPVRRVPGGKLSRVFAFPDELDAWLRDSASPTTGAPPSPPLRGRFRSASVALILGSIGVLAVIGLTFARGATPPAQLAIVGRALVANDTAGRTLWTSPFEVEINKPNFTWHRLTDLDRDGEEDVLAVVETRRPPATQWAAELMRLSSRGDRLWSVSLDDQLSFRGSVFGPPWAAGNLAIYSAAGEPRIAWIVHHFTWWPGQLITFTPDGKRLSTFVNSGWIHHVRQSADLQHLFITGVSNNRRAYFVGALDARSPGGRSPEPPGAAQECLSCPEGDPLRFVVFPRTDVGLQNSFPLRGPTVETMADGRVQVETHENAEPNVAAVIYLLSPSLDVLEARFSDSYWEWHRRLEASGQLRHAAADCPHRGGLTAQGWTRATGWQPLTAPVR